MKISKILVVKIFIFALFGVFVFGQGSVFAATRTWSGLSGDYLLNTAGNWAGGTKPVSGDIINFTSWVGPSNSVNSNEVTLTNDLVSVPIGGLTSSGDFSGNVYTINTLTLTDGASIDLGSDASVQITNLTAQGAVTLDGVVTNLTAVGAVSVSNGGVAYNVIAPSLTVLSGGGFLTAAPLVGQPFPLDIDNMTVQEGSEFIICSPTGTESVITFPITFGGGTGADPAIDVSQCMGADGYIAHNGQLTLSGNLTLLSNTTIRMGSNTATIDGGLTTNGFTLTIDIDGGSMLMGSGTVGNIALTGIIAPGHSPGCLNSGNISGAGTYQIQIGGATVCTGYDQLNVTGTVNLTGATLDTSIYGSFKPVAGQIYTIINNDSSDAVTGSFTSLPEGTNFTVSGYVFKVSYVGGTGNDVILTVVSVPATPDTGYGLPASPDYTQYAVIAIIGLSLIVISAKQLNLGQIKRSAKR